MYIGDVLFAHGGSGFVLSAPAIQKVVQHWRGNIPAYDAYTERNWAGDMVLGKVLRDVGVDLFWAWPHFQGEPVGALDLNVSKVERRPWCWPLITYHHMHEKEIREVWEFEQEWARKGKGVLAHRNVFKEYIVPKISSRRDGWDNLSIDASPVEVRDLEECHKICKNRADCLQYSYASGKCSTSAGIRYGNEATDQCVEYSVAASKCVRWIEGRREDGMVQSNWMIDRLPQYMDEMDTLCGPEEGGFWVV